MTIIQKILNEHLRIVRTLPKLDSTLRTEAGGFYQNNFFGYSDTTVINFSFWLMVAYFDGKESGLVGLEYSPHFDSAGRVQHLPHLIPPIRDRADTSKILPLGHTNFIFQDILHGFFYGSKNIPATLEWLIRKQMAHDSLVGGDVNIVRMTKGKTHWIKQYQYCKWNRVHLPFSFSK